MLTYFITAAIGYFFGCFQSSYLLTKAIKKVDIRSLGNGNAGASNTVVSLGWKYGIIVGILDILKAILSLYLIKYCYNEGIILQDNLQLASLLYLNGLFVILGHNYPFYMGFKGGKGTAPLVGMLLAIDFTIAIVCILSIIIVTVVTNYIALGTISLVIVFVIMSIYLDYSAFSIAIAIIIALMSIYKHIPNIKSIKKGKEIGLRKVINK
ncbi:glycerol-3-phosphate acyltransferase [Alkaliphilus pronyensis]|uniref:Glycerol-3-phosphate acyltransferase n=1 Tax=Alkaliphilus pronyensis TaxID=1482732 RepID=A0A6I0F5R1_9FIRM|nr:glycerol-3-phosphate acyltransferase [Alkaliphilus pronyensis]KAB3531315.1 glycerol-3-phosphate acyltransferase [Alkaliphilus pronyensis]